MSNQLIPDGFHKPTNPEPYNGEPAIIEGDFVKSGGDYKRNYGIDNALLILTGTDSGWWGNLILPKESQIPGGDDLTGEPITSKFLKRHAQNQEFKLRPLIDSGLVESVTVESFNPSEDRIEWIAKIKMTDGTDYFFDSTVGTGHFV